MVELKPFLLFNPQLWMHEYKSVDKMLLYPQVIHLLLGVFPLNFLKNPQELHDTRDDISHTCSQ